MMFLIFSSLAFDHSAVEHWFMHTVRFRIVRIGGKGQKMLVRAKTAVRESLRLLNEARRHLGFYEAGVRQHHD